jgi:hypothetical protein
VRVTGLLRKRINVLRMLFARILVEICKTVATQCEKKNGGLIWRTHHLAIFLARRLTDMAGTTCVQKVRVAWKMTGKLSIKRKERRRD